MLHIEIDAVVGNLSLRASLSADSGTTVIVGPNGAGKSTLLKSVLGVIGSCAGTIRLGDEELLRSSIGVNVPTEERCIGYVPQSYALFPHMTVFQNIAFGVRNCSRDEMEKRVSGLLKELGIEHLAGRKTPSLSGGESQRVALARALAIGPKALLLDEPTSALDANARRRVRRFLANRLKVIGVPTLVVSHDLEEVEALGGRIAVLEEGRISSIGTLEELRNGAQSQFAKEFLSREPVESSTDIRVIDGGRRFR